MFDSGSLKGFGTVPLQVFLPVEADRPVIAGVVEGDPNGEGSHDQDLELRPYGEDQANPRRRSGEGQSDLQASSPGEAHKPAHSIDAVSGGRVHGRRSKRSASASTPTMASL
jgi:hypothetical protein